MLDAIFTGLLAGPPLVVTLRLAALTAGFVLGVRLLAAGGHTADDRNRTLLDAIRRRRPN